MWCSECRFHFKKDFLQGLCWGGFAILVPTFEWENIIFHNVLTVNIHKTSSLLFSYSVRVTGCFVLLVCSFLLHFSSFCLCDILSHGIVVVWQVHTHTHTTYMKGVASNAIGQHKYLKQSCLERWKNCVQTPQCVRTMQNAVMLLEVVVCIHHSCSTYTAL